MLNFLMVVFGLIGLSVGIGDVMFYHVQGTWEGTNLGLIIHAEAVVSAMEGLQPSVFRAWFLWQGVYLVFLFLGCTRFLSRR
jgi:hypothetical protein